MKKESKAPDRRTARTRDALYRALISLILRKGYDAVTVQDIIDEANIGRSTFYDNYNGKEDLLRSGFERLRAHLMEQQRATRADAGEATQRILGFSLAMFEHARDHHQLYRAMAGGRGGTVAMGQLQRLLGELVREDLAAVKYRGVMPQELVVQHIVASFLAATLWWLDRKIKLTAMEIDAMFRCLVLAGIGAEDVAQ